MSKQMSLAVHLQVRPILNFLAPLIEEGYQVEICVLNSVFYGVPQMRKVGVPKSQSPYQTAHHL